MSLDAFLTGFFQQANSIHNTRREQADSYYAKQLERAQTTGAEKIRKRKDEVAQSVAYANQLHTQTGVPKKVLKRLAEGGLDRLQEVEKIWGEAASSGVTMDEDFWLRTYDMASAVDDGSDFSSTFGRLAGADITAAKEREAAMKKETSAGSIGKGALGALFNTDYMPQALQRLEDTEVADGLSAAEVLRTENASPSPGIGPLANPVYLESATGKNRTPNPTYTNQIHRMYQSALKEGTDKFNAEMRQAQDVERGQTPEEGEARIEAVRQKIKDYAVEQVRGIYAGYPEGFLPTNYSAIFAASTPTDPVVAPERSVQEQAQQERMITERPPGIRERMNANPGGPVVTFSHMQGGKVFYKFPDGTVKGIAREKATEVGQYPTTEQPASQPVQDRLQTIIQKGMAGEADEQALATDLVIREGETPPYIISTPNGVLYYETYDGQNYIYRGENGEEVTITKG